MPRIARAVATGFPHHVVQRGNNRQEIFFDREDRTQYLLFLKNYAEKWGSSILAYCLMDNHVHLLMKPKSEVSLSKTMQGVALCYTQYVNKKYLRTGRLWEGRYYSSVIENERYLWTVVRYIEQNPKRAKLVDQVCEYPYSSAKAHVDGSPDKILSEELLNGIQRDDYFHFISANIPTDEIKKIRFATRAGKPFGSIQKPSGRPKKVGK